jgi:chemotaxis signal transduction protein
VSAAMPAPAGLESRLLTFEVGGSMYAIPIAGVLEVIEAGAVTCIPTLSKRCAAVMNWHGDALPLVAPGLLFDGHESDSGLSAEGDLLHGQVLVVSPGGDGNARLGIPIDRVLGVVDGALPTSRSKSLVVERRPIDGRVVSVLDPRLLVVRASEVIEREAGFSGPSAQGEV